VRDLRFCYINTFGGDRKKDHTWSLDLSTDRKRKTGRLVQKNRKKTSGDSLPAKTEEKKPPTGNPKVARL